MKKLFLIPLALLTTYVSLLAQLKVANNGKVGISTSSLMARLTVDGNQDVSFYTKNFFNFDFGDANKLLVDRDRTYALAIYKPNDPNRKWWVDGYGNTAQNGFMWSAGMVYSMGNPVYSDKSLKKNIKVCNNSLDKILSLRGTNYTLVDSFDTYETTSGINFEDIDSLEIQSSTIGGIRKKTKNAEPIVSKQSHKIIDNDKIQYGFIAQEVQKVLPELVVKDVRSGLLTVNYVQIIPILVEAFKSQNATIDALKAQNQKLEARIAKLEKAKKSTASARTESDVQDTQTDTKTASIESELVKTAYLYQNTPNPFSQETQIKYYVTETNANTFVSVTDLSGKQVKLLPITTKGEGFVSIKANELYAGLFIYTLVVDGNIIDSKRMMVVE